MKKNRKWWDKYWLEIKLIHLKLQPQNRLSVWCLDASHLSLEGLWG